MIIKLNGKETDVKDAILLKSLIAGINVDPETIVIEVNRHILKYEDWDRITLNQNDCVEILTFMGGG
ncbi:MAG: sulfur carrier protein ThiS [Elusimicrobia bacterium]|nr:sulfur carrier protein ThiS [Elusimicrobiota bacterium]